MHLEFFEQYKGIKILKSFSEEGKRLNKKLEKEKIRNSQSNKTFKHEI